MSATQVTSLPSLKKRAATAHKGTFGSALIVAGHVGMSGAAGLCGLGALRGGAGLVFVAVPQPILPMVAIYEPSYLTIPLPVADDKLATDASLLIKQLWHDKDAVAIGSGMGRGKGSDAVIRELYQSCTSPLVADADALNVLAGDTSILKQSTGPRILTPHPGEFARLVNQSTAEVQNNRVELAVSFARQHDVILVLKGAGTVVADGEKYYVNNTGNPGMGTGGSGDVLTGLITALLANGYEAFAAAQLGVYLHGLAGDLAADELSQPALIASDLPKFLPHAWKTLLGQQD